MHLHGLTMAIPKPLNRKKRVGSALRGFRKMPGDCEDFANEAGVGVGVARAFWRDREKQYPWLQAELLVLDLVFLRMRKRYWRHRPEISQMTGAHAETVHNAMDRHSMMEWDFPDLYRACIKIEGEDAGWFAIQLARDCGYVEACFKGVTVSDLRQVKVVFNQ